MPQRPAKRCKFSARIRANSPATYLLVFPADTASNPPKKTLPTDRPAIGLGTGGYGTTHNSYNAYPECWMEIAGWCGPPAPAKPSARARDPSTLRPS